MYVHHEKRLVYLAHKKVASRATASVLVDRDFVRVGTHHSGPWDRPRRTDSEFRRFWEAGPETFTYFTTVRNHFDLLLTYRYWRRYQNDYDWSTAEGLRKFLWEEKMTSGTSLFWFLQEVWDVRVWRYESLRMELDVMLKWSLGAPLAPEEFPHLEEHKTSGKPRGDRAYRSKYTEAQRAAVEEVFSQEMEDFGYKF